MTEAARTTAGPLPSDARQPDRRREAAVMGPKEATWLAWYMCALSLMLTALGLVLLVLSRGGRRGVPASSDAGPRLRSRLAEDVGQELEGY